MKILAFFCLIALAIVSAEECSEERVERCIDSLLSTLLGDTTEEEVCRELRTSVNCLRSAVDDCLDESDEDVEEGLQELEKVLRDNCEEGGEGNADDGEMEKCFEENEDYIYECIEEGATQALSLLTEDNTDENTLKCLMYGMMADCFVDRVRDKCGNEAATVAEKELSDIPVEIAQACEESADVIAHRFQLLEDRKKK